MVRAIFVALCALMCSCQIFTVEQIMDTAERQLTDAPDSALCTMRSIRKIAVVLPERKARYGLLYSMVLDKNFVDIASDSLIRFSTQYYDCKGTPEQRMRAYYYLGRAQENAGDNLAATLSFLDAAQYLDQVEDNYLKGLLCSRLGKMYAIYDRNELAFNSIEKSFYYYKSIGLKKHQAYELYSLGKLCHSLNKFAEGITLLNNAVKLADEIDYEALKLYCYYCLISLYDANNQYDEAYKIIRLLNSKNFDDYTLYIGAAAHTLYRKSKISEAEKLMKYGWVVARNARDSSVMFHYQSKIHLYNKNTKSYLNNYAWAVNLQLNEAIKLKENNLDATYADYFQQKNIEAQKIINKKKNTYIIIIAIALIFSILIAVYKHIYAINERKKLSQEIVQYIAVIDDIKATVTAKEEMISKLTQYNETIGNYKYHQNNNAPVIKLSEKFELAKELCHTFIENIDEKKQSAIFKKVNRIINEIRNDGEYFFTIEKSVNHYNQNILSKLKADIPDLSVEEYKLICLICAGFSTQVIALFLNCNDKHIYNCRYRLRRKISALQSEHITLYAKNNLTH